MAKREFLMLAHTFNPSKHGVGGWLMSEKLDGMRCFWDGGITRGMLKSDVPWANTNKDQRYLDPPISTGLWSRYGNVIHAPDYWLDDLPKMPLDGELFIDRNSRQILMSTVKDLIPGSFWKEVKLYCFDIPSYDIIFADGMINNTNYQKTFKNINVWLHNKGGPSLVVYWPSPDLRFESAYHVMKQRLRYRYAVAHKQTQLVMHTDVAIKWIEDKLDRLADIGGEGLVLRNPSSYWRPERSYNLLKVKKTEDAEGKVVGYITGRETDKGSKLLGMMGALILEIEGDKRLELSGFTEAERILVSNGGDEIETRKWAEANPEQECPDWIHAKYFRRGSTISYRYRGKSTDGIPQEARYWRKRVD